MIKHKRHTRHELMPEIMTRYANRALKKDPIAGETLEALVEAAAQAPSCFNEQPWRFLIAQGERRDRLMATLTPQNQEWAVGAPVLIVVLSKKDFSYNGKSNYWHMADTGCATGFMMLEAERRGLTYHPMAGFSRVSVEEAFSIPEDLAIIHVAALGYPGDFESLSEKHQARNHPQPRKPIEELLL